MDNKIPIESVTKSPLNPLQIPFELSPNPHQIPFELSPNPLQIPSNLLLHNEHITLRKLEPTDLPFLYAMENDSDAWASSGVHNPLSQQDLRDYIDHTTGDIYQDLQLRLIIQSRDGETLGAIDLFDFNPHHAKAEMGIYLKPSARGIGIAQQAVSLLLDYAHTILHLHQVYALVPCNNLRSANLFRNAHFQHTATLLAWFNQSDTLLFQYLF